MFDLGEIAILIAHEISAGIGNKDFLIRESIANFYKLVDSKFKRGQDFYQWLVKICPWELTIVFLDKLDGKFSGDSSPPQVKA